MSDNVMHPLTPLFVLLVCLLVGALTFSTIRLVLVTATDTRDPRCDTAARYDAMREGADCNVRER